MHCQIGRLQYNWKHVTYRAFRNILLRLAYRHISTTPSPSWTRGFRQRTHSLQVPQMPCLISKRFAHSLRRRKLDCLGPRSCIFSFTTAQWSTLYRLHYLFHDLTQYVSVEKLNCSLGRRSGRKITYYGGMTSEWFNSVTVDLSSPLPFSIGGLVDHWESRISRDAIFAKFGRCVLEILRLSVWAEFRNSSTGRVKRSKIDLLWTVVSRNRKQLAGRKKLP